jgi:formylglycine-generating enzyme required for sulfatase activity
VVYDRNSDDHHPRAAPPECAEEGGHRGPENVGASSQDRTPEGVQDMGGNVAEWIFDNFVPEYPDCRAPCTDPVVQTNRSDSHVVRGGGWAYWRMHLLSFWRNWYPADETRKTIGFRCIHKHKEAR